MHRYFYREHRRLKNEQKLNKQSSIVADEIAEEKELVLTDVKVISEETTAQVETTEEKIDKDSESQKSNED